MPKTLPTHPADIVGYSRLAIEAVLGLTDLVETEHHNISLAPGVFGHPAQGGTHGITGLVYKSIRGVTKLVGSGNNVGLAPLLLMGGDARSTPEREAALAVLNGILGEHLAATGNPLAITMHLRRRGLPLVLQSGALSAAVPKIASKVLILVHGLCCNDLQWLHQGHDLGRALSRDLGYTAVYLHYNTGRHVSHNGREFAALLESLVQEWPITIEELAIVGHSMGGLVARSAYHYGCSANHRWPQYLRKLIFLGTPHHGTPLERWGNLINVGLELSPYTTAFARLGKIRSAGITDLRYGNLLDEDWNGSDRFAHRRDSRLPLQLPDEVSCYALAALKSDRSTTVTDAFGDGVVPVSSALGRHQDRARTLAFLPSHQVVVTGINHFDLLTDAAVHQQIRSWLAGRERRKLKTCESKKRRLTAAHP
jgi:pimeloyl-ACP methyl ester carboxylesterase